VQHVEDEEDRRGGDGGDHAVAVRDLPAALDEEEAEREEDGAERVQAGVEGGKITDTHKKQKAETLKTEKLKEVWQD
jgi:hypothetical protein